MNQDYTFNWPGKSSNITGTRRHFVGISPKIHHQRPHLAQSHVASRVTTLTKGLPLQLRCLDYRL